MFGEMNVVPILNLRESSSGGQGSLERSVASLLDLTEHPEIKKWIEFPKALFVFLMNLGDPESGAFYIYDRSTRVWYWVDFNDENFGGYSMGDFERLIRECRFLDIVEHPALLRSQTPWVVEPGVRPNQVRRLPT
jgi:hypothetical protein